MSKSKKRKYSRKLKKKYSKKFKRNNSKKYPKKTYKRLQFGCKKQSGGNGPNILSALNGLYNSISYSYDQAQAYALGTQNTMSNPDPLIGNFQRNA